MKKTLIFIWITVLITLCVFFNAITVFAVEPIDVDHDSSLTLQYRLNDKNCEGIEIFTYRIADVEENGVYNLCAPFSDYPVSIYEVTSKTEWKKICDTLAAYIAADGIEADEKGITDSEGHVVFSNVRPGMYLTLSVRVESNEELVVFENFITVIPQTNSKGEHNYNVTAFPKCLSFAPKPGEIEYKVVKQWKDAGYTDKRPEAVEIEIVKDGKIDSVQKLSSQNNWSYKWTASDDASVWQVVERNVPEGYTVTMQESDNTIIITNSYKEQSVTPPQTGDVSSTWPYVVAMCISGALIILLAVWSKRTEA